MKTLFFLIASGFYSILSAQNFQKEFKKYFDVFDIENEKKTLTQWEEKKPSDPELYIAYFEHLYRRSKKSSLHSIENQIKTNSNTTSNLMNSIDYSLLNLALDKIENGITLNPDRIDMRFGKIYALGQAQQWKNFTGEIIKVINQSVVNNNQWRIGNNMKQADGKEYMLQNIQTYQNLLYHTNDENSLIYMRDIAATILGFYPSHLESLTNISVTHLAKQEYEQGITALLKAEKIAPQDEIILSNIAQAYHLKGDKYKAIEYYQKCILYGDENIKNFAQAQIDTLKKE